MNVACLVGNEGNQSVKGRYTLILSQCRPGMCTVDYSTLVLLSQGQRVNWERFADLTYMTPKKLKKENKHNRGV